MPTNGRALGHGEAEMAEPAEKRWTVEEFLAWDDGTDHRYELVDGEVVAMAPPSEAHGTIEIVPGSIPLAAIYEGSGV